MQTTKSVSYHLTTSEDFRIHCLMTLNAQKAFDSSDFSEFKRLVSKIKKNQKLSSDDKISLKNRLGKYTWDLAKLLNR